ncbi:hypothetical protein [uncultured Psychroserpens sp.]|uniref:hypothetical protein n=1 Tax=uncultured Psychroserpens sp. TaxID=255436 RepID=UPI0026311544|nr:hypothetical protein [uncultured Psychroserpens sp.]
MKFYKPLFSIILISIQLLLSLKEHYKLEEWRKENPVLDGIVHIVITYDSLFLFVLIIGIYEITTKPSWFKTVIRCFLASIILGTAFSDFIPIDDFYSGVYNTAWFSSVVAILLILIRIVKFAFEKRITKKSHTANN